MTTLTAEQESLLLKRIETLRTTDGKMALRLNDTLFKFLCALNANGFIDGEEFNRLDHMRYEALMKIRKG